MAEVDDLKLLAQRHEDEVRQVARYHAYYHDGNDRALDLPAQARRELAPILEIGRTPWLKITVDAPAERLIVDGFRVVGSDQADDEIWRWWQENKLDGRQMPHYVETLKSAYSFVSVWPTSTEDGSIGVPKITPEPASNVFVAYDDPSDPFMATKALKVRNKTAWVYYPDRVVRLEKVGETWEKVAEIENPLGAVPYVKFRANPDLIGGCRSDLEVGIPVQDRINRTTIDRLLAQAFSAFRQRWATGLKLDEDEEGNILAPFKIAHDRLWTAEDANVKFGEFGEASLDNYIKAVESDVHHLAAVTRTPPHYLIGELVNIGAEQFAAAETGFSRRIAAHQQTIGEAWEEVIALAAKAAEREDLTAAKIETIWRRTEMISEAQAVDAAIKLMSLGVPTEALWERIGATPMQIKAWRRQAQQDALRVALRAPLNVGGADPNATPAEETEES